MSNQPSSLKETGICPRCGSHNVKSGAKIEGKEGLYGGNRMAIDKQRLVELDNYVCVDCGFVESYIGDRGILNRIERFWDKVEVTKEDES